MQIGMHIIADTVVLAAVIPLLLHLIWVIVLLAIVLVVVCASLSNIAELNFVTHETISHQFFPPSRYHMPSPCIPLTYEHKCMGLKSDDFWNDWNYIKWYTKHVHMYISGSKNGVKQEVDRSHTCYPNFRFSFICSITKWYHQQTITVQQSYQFLVVDRMMGDCWCIVMVSIFDISMKFGSTKALSHSSSPCHQTKRFAMWKFHLSQDQIKIPDIVVVAG